MSKHQLDSFFELKLVEIVNGWKGDDKECMIEKIKRCFIENEINDGYFQTNTRKQFQQLLQKYDIKRGKAIKLWKVFGNNNNSDSNESKTVDNEYEHVDDREMQYDSQQLTPPPWIDEDIATENETKQDEKENNEFPLSSRDILPAALPPLLYPVYPILSKNGSYVSGAIINNQEFSNSLREIEYSLSISIEVSFVLYIVYLHRLYYIIQHL